MSDLYVLPWVARLGVGYLLETLDDELAAQGFDWTVGTNIGTDRGHDDFPFVEVVQLGGPVIEPANTHWLSVTLLQVNCYASGGSERYKANRTAATVAALLASWRGTVAYTIGGSTESGVVNGTEVGLPRDDEDNRYKPARPYAHLTATVASHPEPHAGS